MSKEEMVTVRDIMIELNVAEKTVRRWLQAGLLPYTKDIVGRYHIKRSDLDAFIEKRLGEQKQ